MPPHRRKPTSRVSKSTGDVHLLPSYRRLLSHFHPTIMANGFDKELVTSPDTEVPIVGFSATFSRHDGVALGSIFERIVYHKDFLEMIKANWCACPLRQLRLHADIHENARLCPVRFTSVKAQVDLSGVTINSGTGDFNARSLAHVINTSSINKLAVQTWLDRAGGGVDGSGGEPLADAPSQLLENRRLSSVSTSHMSMILPTHFDRSA